MIAEPQTPTTDIQDAEIAQILSAYQHRKLREHLTGPIISFALHVFLLSALTYYVRGRVQETPPPIEIISIEPDILPIEPEPVEPIENTEEVETPSPKPATPIVEAPNAATEENDQIDDPIDPETESEDIHDPIDVTIQPPVLLLPTYMGPRGSQESRAKAVSDGGGSKRGQQAVLKALRWLASVQLPNGSWQNHGGHSGLALLCFLAHGDTPLSEEFGLTVQKAMRWLANGMPSGDRLFGNKAYTHGIATYALAESYSMTQIPFVRLAMENGLAKIVEGQQPDGGFDYRYTKGPRWDLSVAGWQFQALKAGYVAGANVPKLEEAITKSTDFLKHHTYQNGKFGYTSPGSGGNMTGVGTVCLQLLGEANSRHVRGGIETITEERFKQLAKFMDEDTAYWIEHAGHPLYGWYYDTQAVFHKGGDPWKKWRKTFETVLIRNQHTDGYWVVERGHGMNESLGGRILPTTFCTLQLEVYYRQLPTFKLSPSNVATAKSDLFEDDAGLIIK